MIDDLFKVHKLNDVGMERAHKLAAEFDALLQSTKETIGIGDPRCAALFRTHLELASFYAKKAVAMNVQHHVRES